MSITNRSQKAADGSKANQDELDSVLAGWTRKFDGLELESKLQSHGIPAAKVASSADMLVDPNWFIATIS
jgi:crotonobetainyl-CoA:carnitine CoA-transferase CaiB-like acyl-CoA transferase